ncbi:type II toxin-antitoxin system RelE/ParE family toxin [Photobacterium sp. 2_MG-2023]|uniref:type II toxin-antitoxin system RelE/ParE family toxin n=1 Tax=Photobacterium sp. 2_MG-2023 TaxID=3062663 RepID=UPI0026E2534A|nr:type II toxin-antitoxin system RelE/ParE family toxin [Photobacterium sp. 2_MG-2023]MDO6583224.1 type II toxin-antitoxin system RelE/ParE family toxin [Photobacterium sp. 2_MG-2023]
MQDYEVEWEMDALQDRANHYKYLHENASENVADSVDNKIQEAANNLAILPYSGKAVSDGMEGRTLYVTGTRYLIYYVVSQSSKAIKILRIFHSRQRHP